MQQIRHKILGVAVRTVCGSAGTSGVEGRDQGKRERDVGEVWCGAVGGIRFMEDVIQLLKKVNTIVEANDHNYWI